MLSVVELPTATAELRTPSAQPTRCRGVPPATSAVDAAIVPEVAPWMSRSATRSSGPRAKPMRPTLMAPPIIALTSIARRP